jgi:hypothetical protein
MNTEQIQQLAEKIIDEVSYFGMKRETAMSKAIAAITAALKSATPIQAPQPLKRLEEIKLPELTEERIDYLTTENIRVNHDAPPDDIELCFENYQNGLKDGYQEAIENMVEMPQAGVSLEDILKIHTEHSKLLEVIKINRSQGEGTHTDTENNLIDQMVIVLAGVLSDLNKVLQGNTQPIPVDNWIAVEDAELIPYSHYNSIVDGRYKFVWYAVGDDGQDIFTDGHNNTTIYSPTHVSKPLPNPPQQ